MRRLIEGNLVGVIDLKRASNGWPISSMVWMGKKAWRNHCMSLDSGLFYVPVTQMKYFRMEPIEQRLRV